MTSNSYELLGYPPQNANNAVPSCAQTFGSAGPAYDIASDAAGNVYVPAVSRPGVIYVHEPACGKPIATITDTFNEPTDVAVNGSTVYAAGLKPRKYSGQSVAVCTLSGCARELTGPITVFGKLYIAVDSKGNVWGADYSSSGGIEFIVWPNGTMPAKVVSGNVGSGYPGEMMFDRQDTLVMVEYSKPEALTFSCNATTAQCTRTRRSWERDVQIAPVAGFSN